MMNLIDSLTPEFQHEAQTTRKHLERLLNHEPLDTSSRQFSVYLRLLNIPMPGSYGPSADELGM